jgi:glycosyltransferase involved in cell wall biosynthesis
MISCVVPVWNGERYLAEALDSVLTQTRPPDEIVVVDDGSTDGSADIVHGYGSKLRYVRQTNAGSAAARNRGLAESRGDLVCFLDQDDVWEGQKLEWQMEELAARPHTDICAGHVELFWVAGLEREGRRYRDHARGHRVPGYTAKAMLARRAAFDRVGGFDPALTYADGADWFLRAIDLGLDILVLPQVVLRHRMHHSNLTRQREPSKREFVRMVKATLDRRRRAEGIVDSR